MSQQLDELLASLKYNVDGLIPAIAQDVNDGQVLMLAYMNLASLRQTLQTGYACYYSRSRQQLWVKGETSGHRQRIISIRLDCDLDTILLLVEQNGVACHEGYKTCFFRELKSTEEHNVFLEVIEKKP